MIIMGKMAASRVAQTLDISVQTLNNWYRWYLDTPLEKPKDMPPLPSFEQSHDRGIRYWDSNDIKKLEKFKEWLPKGRAGVMGDYTARFWGERGKRALKNKVTKNQ